MKVPELHNDVLKIYIFLPNSRRYAIMRELFRNKGKLKNQESFTRTSVLLVQLTITVRQLKHFLKMKFSGVYS